jgi:hypothetical protein
MGVSEQRRIILCKILFSKKILSFSVLVLLIVNVPNSIAFI